MDRRQFLKLSAATTASLILGSDLRAATIPRRWLATECLAYNQPAILQGSSSPRFDTGRTRCDVKCTIQDLNCWTVRPFQRLYDAWMPGWLRIPGRPEHYGRTSRIVMKEDMFTTLSDINRENTLLLHVPGADIVIPHVIFTGIGVVVQASGMLVGDRVEFVSSKPQICVTGETAVQWKEYDESASQIVWEGSGPSA